jgi:hypothetical protein
MIFFRVNHETLISQFQYQKFSHTVISMKNNEVPSPYGIPTEFFKNFSIMRVVLLLRMIIIKKLLISTVHNINFYYLIKFGIMISLVNEILFLLFQFP